MRSTRSLVGLTVDDMPPRPAGTGGPGRRFAAGMGKPHLSRPCRAKMADSGRFAGICGLPAEWRGAERRSKRSFSGVRVR